VKTLPLAVSPRVPTSPASTGVDGSPDLRDATVCCRVDPGFGHDRPPPWESESALDYPEVLRRLAINDEHFAEECVTGTGAEAVELEPRTLTPVRLAALMAVGGAEPSYEIATDAAFRAAASTAETVAVPVGIVSVVGLPSVVAAAPYLAMALECHIEGAR
jgi:hypothetical protein